MWSSEEREDVGRLPGRVDDGVSLADGTPGRPSAAHTRTERWGAQHAVRLREQMQKVCCGARGWSPLPRAVDPTPQGSGLGFPQITEAVMSVQKRGMK